MVPHGKLARARQTALGPAQAGESAMLCRGGVILTRSREIGGSFAEGGSDPWPNQSI